MLTKRFTTYQLAALTTDTTSPTIDLSNYASGEIAIPSGSPITTLTYYVLTPSVSPGEYAAYDATPAAITQTVAASRAYPIPAAVFGAAQIRIKVNAAGSVHINLKS